MEITQVVLAVVVVIGTLLVGLAAIVPTLLELPADREDVEQTGRRSPIDVRRARYRPRPAATEAGVGLGPAPSRVSSSRPANRLPLGGRIKIGM